MLWIWSILRLRDFEKGFDRYIVDDGEGGSFTALSTDILVSYDVTCGVGWCLIL